MCDCDFNFNTAFQRKPSPDEDIPIILIAGTESGVGKTSVTLALVRALVRSGRTVQPFKVGPDFLDPTYLARAAGRPCYNLDTWMGGAAYVAALVSAKRENADVVVIEGVMGLFDGAQPDSIEGSAAETAQLLDASVLLVCDAAGQAGSFAATVKGFVDFEPGVRIAGVPANHVGSAAHTRLLEEALSARHLPPLFGGIEEGALPKLESRHLGLVAADTSTQFENTLEALTDAFSSRIPLEPLLESLRRSGVSKCNAPTQKAPHGQNRHGIRLGIARDAAFSFYYPDNLEAFETAGFELVPFSPIADPSLPFGLDALYIGGGYPEISAKSLSNNESMRSSIRSFCRSGRPVYTECGGLMYMSEGIVLTDGSVHPMTTGVLPGVCRMQTGIRALGYAEVVLKESSLFGEAGTRLRGHAFHYSDFENTLAFDRGWRLSYDVELSGGRSVINEGYCKDNLLFSYVHLHLASHPSAVIYFRDHCLKWIETGCPPSRA